MDLSPYAGETVAAHFPASIANNTVEGRLVAMPWFGDAGILYYRKDLLEKHERPVPRTWQELTETAEAIQRAERAEGQARLWGLVFQARAYEGLTCVAPGMDRKFRWRDVRRTRRTGLHRQQGRRRCTCSRGVLDRKHRSALACSTTTEEESRRVFQSGNAVFMRNWPYAWALVDGDESAVRGKVGVTHLPHGAK